MKRTVIYGVLNWGLGHATRSIPIIRSLISLGYQPIICSDGDALSLLRKEFTNLDFVELPTYRIQYKHRSMLANVSCYGLGLLKTIHQEEKILSELVEQYQPSLVISDNRYGFYHPRVKSVMITHQLRIPANTNWQSQAASHFLHRYVEKFDSCWVPDVKTSPNLSGKLSHDVALKIPVEYIGPLSRFSKVETETKYDLAFVLSGPEPQRTYLEKLIIDQWPSTDLKCILVRGTKALVDKEFEKKFQEIKYIDLADSRELQQIISESKIIFSRAGYTTVMDLVAMQKSAILIPTPGQPEQEYLAQYLSNQFSSFRFINQDNLILANIIQDAPKWNTMLEWSSWSDEKLTSLLVELEL